MGDEGLECRCGGRFVEQPGDFLVPCGRFGGVGVGRVFAAKAELALARGFDVLQQVGHGRGIELLPGLPPGLQIAMQCAGAQGVRHGHCLGDGRCSGRCDCRQCARAVQPKGIHRVLPAGVAGVVDGVVVEQHLHLALQPLQGPGGGVLGHPVFHVLANHPVERGGGQIGQHRALGVPAQGAVPSHLQAVFL